MKLLLFDIDGTLVSTGGAGVRALNRAFREVVGLENALNGIRPHGKTDPAIVREVFNTCEAMSHPMDGVNRILDAYLRFLPDEVQGSPTYRVLPGILSFLEDFHNRPGLAFGLATGTIERGARIKLVRGRLNRYFPCGGFGSDSENRAELVRQAAQRGAEIAGVPVSPDAVFVIGDTPRDIDAGREAGFRTVGVATSDYSRDDLQAAGAGLVLSDFESGRDQFLRMARIEYTCTRLTGDSPCTGSISIFRSTSMPSMTLPNTVYVPFKPGCEPSMTKNDVRALSISVPRAIETIPAS